MARPPAPSAKKRGSADITEAVKSFGKVRIGHPDCRFGIPLGRPPAAIVVTGPAPIRLLAVVGLPARVGQDRLHFSGGISDLAVEVKAAAAFRPAWFELEIERAIVARIDRDYVLTLPEVLLDVVNDQQLRIDRRGKIPPSELLADRRAVDVDLDMRVALNLDAGRGDLVRVQLEHFAKVGVLHRSANEGLRVIDPLSLRTRIVGKRSLLHPGRGVVPDLDDRVVLVDRIMQVRRQVGPQPQLLERVAQAGRLVADRADAVEEPRLGVVDRVARKSFACKRIQVGN